MFFTNDGKYLHSVYTRSNILAKFVTNLKKEIFRRENDSAPQFICYLFLFTRSRHQQYECKWYIPLADLTFQSLDDCDSCPSIQVLPEYEIEEMKIKISVTKSEIQKEKVILLVFMGMWS